MKTIKPAHDVARIMTQKFEAFGATRLYSDLRKKRKDPTFQYRQVYEGFVSKSIYKLGHRAIWVSYVSTRKFDASVRHKFWVGGVPFRKHIRDTKIANLGRCKFFMRWTREAMLAAGYIEFPKYEKKNNAILYMQLSPRFYRDMFVFRNGFKELDVLARVDQNKKGLLGCYLVHRIFYKKGEARYVLQNMEYGTILRDFQAMTLRELVLHGYYRIGKSSNTHVCLMNTYWKDTDRRLYYPPETGYIKCNDITYKMYVARKKRMRRKVDRYNGTYTGYCLLFT